MALFASRGLASLPSCVTDDVAVGIPFWSVKFREIFVCVRLICFWTVYMCFPRDNLLRLEMFRAPAVSCAMAAASSACRTSPNMRRLCMTDSLATHAALSPWAVVLVGPLKLPSSSRIYRGCACTLAHSVRVPSWSVADLSVIRPRSCSVPGLPPSRIL